MTRRRSAAVALLGAAALAGSVHSSGQIGGLFGGDPGVAEGDVGTDRPDGLVLPAGVPDRASAERRRAVSGSSRSDDAGDAGDSVVPGADRFVAAPLPGDGITAPDAAAPQEPVEVESQTESSRSPEVAAPQVTRDEVAEQVPAAAPSTEAVAVAPPTAGAPVIRSPLRMQVTGIRRVRAARGGDDDVLLTVAAVGEDEDESVAPLSVRVAIPKAGANETVGAAALRVDLGVVASKASDERSLVVRVALSDAAIEEPVLARSEAGDDAASDTIQLWVPLERNDDDDEAPELEPEEGEAPDDSASAPVDVVAALPGDGAAVAPVDTTVTLEPLDDAAPGGPAVIVQVGSPTPAY